MFRTFLFLCGWLLISSFGKPEVHINKFRNWYAENKSELVTSANNEAYHFEAAYIPKELKVLRELRNMDKVNKKELKALNKKYDGNVEFRFKIRRDGVRDLLKYHSQDEAMYQQLQFYLIESIFNDFTLVSSEDERLKPLHCSFENNYGAAPFISLHLVFDHPKGKWKELNYQDHLFGNGAIEMNLQNIEQLKIPKIK